MQPDRTPYWRTRRAGPLDIARIIASRTTSQVLHTHASCSSYRLSLNETVKIETTQATYASINNDRNYKNDTPQQGGRFTWSRSSRVRSRL